MNEIKIKDIIVVARKSHGQYPVGEANVGTSATRVMLPSEREAMCSRLLNGISRLLMEACDDHRRRAKIGGTQETDRNYMTRLSTNEFFFYTQEPLTVFEFEDLFTRIVQQMKILPEGIQLILGSFAVKTLLDNAVMNVTPHLSSGNPPRLYFLVKNHTSPADVRYKEEGMSLPSLDVFSCIGLPSLEIDDVDFLCTFNTLIPCKTPAGEPFITAVEVCLDHYKAVTMHQLIEFTQESAEDVMCLPISHVVLSNTLETIFFHSIEPMVHVDPYYSHRKHWNDVRVSDAFNPQPHFFGNDPIDIFDCPPIRLNVVLDASKLYALYDASMLILTQLNGQVAEEMVSSFFHAKSLSRIHYCFASLNNDLRLKIKRLVREVTQAIELAQELHTPCSEKLKAHVSYLQRTLLGHADFASVSLMPGSLGDLQQLHGIQGLIKAVQDGGATLKQKNDERKGLWIADEMARMSLLNPQVASTRMIEENLFHKLKYGEIAVRPVSRPDEGDSSATLQAQCETVPEQEPDDRASQHRGPSPR